MSSNRTEPRSITSRLVLLFTIAATLLLFCGLSVFYLLVVRHTFAEDNAVLADKISAITADLRSAEGSNILREELRTPRGHERAPYWIRVLDASRQTLTETPGMDRVLPVDIFPIASGPSSSIASAKDYHRKGRLFSLVSFQESTATQSYLVQIAQDRSEDEEFRRKFGILLALVLALGAIASAIIAIKVTKRGLHPLQEITRAVERIGPTHLSERVAPAGWPRELQPLALAFDQMLGRLEDSFTRLSQFSADLAHELRTPLTNIMGEAQVALTRDRSPQEYREVIESTIAECERLSGIAENLLFVARADAAREPVQQELFDGRAALEKIASFYQTISEDRQVTIHCSGNGQIYGDPMLFERAVGNLVDNALRFVSHGGEITLSIQSTAANSEITVADNGQGIAPEHLPRVFDRFYRADASRSSGGAGLGLALVKSIVDLHGGSARIESELGRGTTVTLTFPVRQN